ncbi:MAG: polysaccharide export protein [Verrucomicrobia bacterium]|nr:polysaccharide export protein [Verrucomicrobiota bacterium]
MKTVCFSATMVCCAALLGAIGASTAQAAATDEPVTDYRIHPLDTIYVFVLGETNLCLDCKVQASGEISYPLLGNVNVAGETAFEAQKKLRDLLAADYLVNPQIVVTVKNYRVRTVTVMGEVTKGGALVIPEEQKWSIPEAIGQAGGFTKMADLKKIKFTRNGVTKTYKFQQLLKDLNDPRKTIWLEPGDVITVPQTLF